MGLYNVVENSLKTYKGKRRTTKINEKNGERILEKGSKSNLDYRK